MRQELAAAIEALEEKDEQRTAGSPSAQDKA